MGVAGNSTEKVKGQNVQGGDMAKTLWKNMSCAFENCRLRGAGASGGRREGQQDTEKLCVRTAVPSPGVTDKGMSSKPWGGETLPFPALSQAWAPAQRRSEVTSNLTSQRTWLWA